jgi:hypothetical protein
MRTATTVRRARGRDRANRAARGGRRQFRRGRRARASPSFRIPPPASIRWPVDAADEDHDLQCRRRARAASRRPATRGGGRDRARPPRPVNRRSRSVSMPRSSRWPERRLPATARAPPADTLLSTCPSTRGIAHAHRSTAGAGVHRARLARLRRRYDLRPRAADPALARSGPSMRSCWKRMPDIPLHWLSDGGRAPPASAREP